MNAQCTVIVLAAGLPGRFGGAGQNLMQQLDGGGDDGAVLSVTLRNAIASQLPVLVVATAELAPLAYRQVAARHVVTMPPQRKRGVGDAIAAGVSARAHAAGWLILPADMHRVLPQTLPKIALALQTHAVAFAQYRGRRGHPVGFSAELFSELVGLSGDEGARRLVARYPSEAVDVDDPGVLMESEAEQATAALRDIAGGVAVSPLPLSR